MKSPAMIPITTVFGILLVIQGLVFWGIVGFDGAKWTAAIPTIFGIVLLLCALAGKALPAARMHVMHLAVLIAPLGIGAGGVRFIKGLGADPIETLKVADQGLLVLLCLAYLVFAVRSFIAARANRTGEINTSE